ncbi:PEP-CTERM sorting domain-containing protein [Singulisphaera rosea]
MRLKYVVGFGLLAGILAGRPVSADPLQTFVATYTDSLGSSFSGIPVTMSDLTQGATIELGTLPITGTPGPGGTYPLTGTFELDVSLKPPQGWPDQNPLHYDTALLNGEFSGSILGPTGNSPSLGGGFHAPVGGASFSPGSYNDIPALGALMLHPERVQVNADVITLVSGKSALDIRMTIAPPGIIIPPPPPTVPEPTTLATIVLGLTGIAFRRIRLRR